MPFAPWTQAATLPPGAEEKPPPEREKSWWERGMERWKGSGGFTMPWQQEHWEAQPAWTRHLGKAGLGVGLAAGGAALGMAAPGALFGLGSRAPWLAGLAGAGARLAPATGHLGGLGAVGGLGGLMTSAFMAPGSAGAPGPAMPPTGVVPTPPTEPIPTTPPTLPEPGAEGTAEQPLFFTDESGMRWVYNEYTGEWTMVQAPRVPGLTPEQEMAQSEAQRAHQMEMLRMQYELEQQAMGQQAGASREQQATAAAQQMAQMYAADPYKYWAQMGTPTPEAVARLTGGEIGAGEAFRGGVPLSTPSAQWWGNLLPSEQQQIAGGLNWMGVNPEDWYSMYQRMIPGLGQRQMAPVWAR